MDIKEIRMLSHMSQRQFAGYFGIPLGTLRNWEQEIARPPAYVISMIIASVRRDKMINVETIKFTKLLEELAAMTKNGIADFANATEENRKEKVFYDKSTMDADGRCRVVQDMCVEDEAGKHHDAIGYYDSNTDEYRVRVAVDEEGENPCVEVSLLVSGEIIIIDNGQWYFA